MSTKIYYKNLTTKIIIRLTNADTRNFGNCGNCEIFDSKQLQ